MDHDKLLQDVSAVLEKHQTSYTDMLQLGMSLLIKVFTETNLSDIEREAVFQEIHNATKHFKETHEYL